MNIKFMPSFFLTASAVLMLSASSLALAARDDGMATVSDTAITATVKAKYLEDSRFKNSDISVTTTNGVVTLTGTATGPEASNAAVDLAQHVKGVNSVDNQIVAPIATPSMATKIEDKTLHVTHATERLVDDSWITTKVKSALLADNITKGLKISVDTRHHNVFLSGFVDTQGSMDEVIRLASKIDGVDMVDSSALHIAKN
ncbi:MAG: BON domain-containing protein [Pseudomonadales bacterium]|nr:BON domain-containing protein [Pseudomonadales bacterium]